MIPILLVTYGKVNFYKRTTLYISDNSGKLSLSLFLFISSDVTVWYSVKPKCLTLNVDELLLLNSPRTSPTCVSEFKQNLFHFKTTLKWYVIYKKTRFI